MEILDSITPFSYKLSIQTEVTLHSPNSLPKKATFLGRSLDSERKWKLYFLDHESNEIHFLYESDIQNVPASDQIQTILSPKTQYDESCAAHSLFHCFQWLNELGALTHDDLRFKLKTEPDFIFDQIKKQPINTEVQKLYIQWVKLGKPKSLSHYFKDYQLQKDSRLELLDLFNAPGTPTYKLEELKNHLKKGLPALFGFQTHPSLKTSSRTSWRDHSMVENHQHFIPNHNEENAGRHSVLLLAWIETKKAQDQKSYGLVLDSSPGGFYLIPEEELVRSLSETDRIRRGEAVLVNPRQN